MPWLCRQLPVLLPVLFWLPQDQHLEFLNQFSLVAYHLEALLLPLALLLSPPSWPRPWPLLSFLQPSRPLWYCLWQLPSPLSSPLSSPPWLLQLVQQRVEQRRLMLTRHEPKLIKERHED